MPSTRSQSGLNRCPFCGCRKIRVRHTSSEVHCACTKCGCQGPHFTLTVDDDGQKSDDQAVDAWKKRIAVNKRPQK